jgi:hypothetical protein
VSDTCQRYGSYSERYTLDRELSKVRAALRDGSRSAVERWGAEIDRARLPRTTRASWR